MHLSHYLSKSVSLALHLHLVLVGDDMKEEGKTDTKCVR